MKVLAIYGTRPEYLKVKPLVKASKSQIKTFFIKQHSDILNFGSSDHSIEIDNTCKNRLNSIFEQILLKAEKTINKYDFVLIQGDTATVLASALCAFHLKKKIIYLESGLRSFDLNNPYPEEGYRQMISRIADIHLCPTDLSAKNLRKENIKNNIHIVGNTCLDNIVNEKSSCSYDNQILITLHRNENLPIISQWLSEIDLFAKQNKDLDFIFPIHPNPQIVKAAAKFKNIKKYKPLSHSKLISVLKKCKFIITDSGGIQEEASFLNKKIIVCRKTTERPEAIKTGHIKLCTSPKLLNKWLKKVNEDFIISNDCPYGDGSASQKILQIIKNYV